jgi:CRP/FNR family cyclic AMP-dependent transcriptional regulator
MGYSYPRAADNTGTRSCDAPGSGGRRQLLGFETMTWVEALGWLGAALAIVGSAMKTILPLRMIAITANGVGLVYSIWLGLCPGVIVNIILLPLNTFRMIQMLRLISKADQAAKGDLSIDWLEPFMNRREVAAGELLFVKDDTADTMFYTLTGRYRLRESGIEVPPGSVVGEMGFLSPDNRRTQTLESLEAGSVLAITYEQLRQLYFENPEFGFYFLRLTGERLFQNMAAMEREIAHLRVAPAVPATRVAWFRGAQHLEGGQRHGPREPDWQEPSGLRRAVDLGLHRRPGPLGHRSGLRDLRHRRHLRRRLRGGAQPRHGPDGAGGCAPHVGADARRRRRGQRADGILPARVRRSHAAQWRE